MQEPPTNAEKRTDRRIERCTGRESRMHATKKLFKANIRVRMDRGNNTEAF